MKLIEWLKNNSGGILAAAIVTITVVFDYYKCPIYLLLGFPCPTCGVTRALISLLSLDFAKYFEYNAMAVFLLSTVILMPLRHLISQRRSIEIYTYTVLAVNTVYYVIRLFVWLK